MTPRSAQEMRLAHELSAVVDLDLTKHKIKVAKRLVDVDIVMDSLKTVVEFDGAYWHRDKVARDKKKTKEIEEAGWTVVRIREKPLKKIHKNDLLVANHGDIKEITNEVLAHFTKLRLLSTRAVSRYLKSDRPWRDKQALKAIRLYQRDRLKSRRKQSSSR